MDIEARDRRVAVIGAGTMGAGIAQLAAMNGYAVGLCDRSADQLESAEKEIAGSLGKLVRSGRLEAPRADASRAAIGMCASVEEAATGAGAVIEAVVEVL